jgi:two-component system, NtrC family, response regulator HydG
MNKSVITQTGQKPTILIVEDDESARKFLSRIFVHLDFPFVAVESGEQAVNFASTTHFDIAFVDMVLNGMNGVKTLKELKKVLPEIKSVVFTGYAEQQMIEEAMNIGADAVLDKPFSLTEIFGIMSRMLAGKKKHPK